MLIRPSTEADVPTITEIYAHHVLHGTATFEIQPPDAAEMVRRRAGILARGMPYLVAEDRGVVAGYAYAGPYRPRPGYRFTVEDSVYIDTTRAGKGIGSALLERLIADVAAAGARQMIAVIGDSANVASVRLHEKFGFRYVGVLRSVGYKFDRWIDSVLMQRDLEDAARNRDAPVQPIISSL